MDVDILKSLFTVGGLYHEQRGDNACPDEHIEFDIILDLLVHTTDLIGWGRRRRRRRRLATLPTYSPIYHREQTTV